MAKKIFLPATFLTILFLLVSSLFVDVGTPGFDWVNTSTSSEFPTIIWRGQDGGEGQFLLKGTTRGFPFIVYGNRYGTYAEGWSPQPTFFIWNLVANLLIWFGVSSFILIGARYAVKFTTATSTPSKSR